MSTFTKSSFRINFSIIIIIIGVITRLSTIDLHPLNYDEIIATSINRFGDLSQILEWIKVNDTQQPLFFVITYLFSTVFGDSVISLRMPGLLFSLAGLWQSFLFVKDLKGREVAYVSTALLSVSFITILHSNEVRPYSLVLLLSIISTRYLMKILIRRDKIGILKYLSSTILLIYTHYYGLLLFAVHMLILLKEAYCKDRRILKLYIPILVGVLLFFIPFISDFITDFNVYHQYRPPPSFYKVSHTIVYFLSGKYSTILIASIVGSIVFLDKKRGKLIKENALFILLIVMPFLIALLKSHISSPAFEARYLIIITFPIMALIANLICKNSFFKDETKSFFIVCISIFFIGNYSWKENFFKSPYRLDSRGASNYINKEIKDKPLVGIVGCNLCMQYYVKEKRYQCVDTLRKQNVDLTNISKLLFIDYENDNTDCGLNSKFSKEYSLKEKVFFNHISVSKYVKK